MKKILLITVLIGIIIFGFYFFQKQKTGSQSTITPVPTIASKEEPMKDQIIQALSRKNSWDLSRVEVNVITVEGNFAKGDVKLKDEMGGGLWFAARVNGGWQIVYDGNGIITCDELTNYQNFPKDLIPSCYDEKKDKLLTR